MNGNRDMELSRIKSSWLRDLVTDVDSAVSIIPNGSTVAFGGQVSVGCPKALPRALSVRAQNEELSLKILSTSNNKSVDDELANGVDVQFRSPMTDSKLLSGMINKGIVDYCEQQMNKMPELLHSGSFGKIDFVVVEATKIDDYGNIYPTTSIGIEQTFLDLASSVIVEINTAFPEELSNLHDTYFNLCNNSVPYFGIDERLGKNYLRVKPEKIKAIVYTNELDSIVSFAESSEAQKQVASNLINFLELEQKKRGWKKLPPIQTGFGNLANEIVNQFDKANWRNLSFFAGHLQESNIKMLISGKVDCACCSSVYLNKNHLSHIVQNIDYYKEKLIIRNAELINNSISTARFSPITITSGIEIDIYGNVNSSHISGSRVVNGLGGAANFAANAGLSIVVITSESKNGLISNIVPMVSHQDISEHNIDVVVTDNGVADLRGKSDINRAKEIIDNCSGSYKNQLKNWLKRACNRGGHHPILLDEAFSWHINLKNNGSMRME